MPDPVALTIGIPAILKAVDLGVQLFGGRVSKEDGKKLTMRLWGSILFEMRANCNRARHLVRQWNDKRHFMLRTMSFTVTNAVLPELCRLLPEPIVLHEMNRVDSSLRAVECYHRLAVSSEDQLSPSPSGALPPNYARALGFAEDLKNRGDLVRYNNLVRLASDFGNAVFDAEWQMLSPGMVPDPIDLSASVPGDDV